MASHRVRSKRRVPVRLEFAATPQAVRELGTYLVAIHSYAEHFERVPHLTFEQHLLRIIEGQRRDSGKAAH